ncbi:MAG: septum formation initiator family protein [Wenzhouxiangellaceae bacterium]
MPALRGALTLRIVILILIILLVLLQFEVWQQYGMVGELEQRVEQQRDHNRELAARNQALAAEVDDLRSGLAAVEERARAELGLVREGEQFYLVVDPDDLSPEDLDAIRRLREASRLQPVAPPPSPAPGDRQEPASQDRDGDG